MFCRGHYRVDEDAGLSARLEAIPGLEVEGGSGTRFAWLEPGGVGQRSLGSVEVKGDRLVLECMSEGRLARGRALLEEHLGSAITHRGDSVQDPWAAIAERKEGPPGTRQEKLRPFLPKWRPRFSTQSWISTTGRGPTFQFPPWEGRPPGRPRREKRGGQRWLI